MTRWILLVLLGWVIAASLMLTAATHAQPARVGQGPQPAEAQPAADATFTLGKPVNLAQAGLKISMPAGFQRRLSKAALAIYSGADEKKAQWRAAILYAAATPKPLEADADRTSARALVDAFRKRAGGEEFTLLVDESVTIGERTAHRIAADLKIAGKPESMVILVWRAKLPKTGLHMQYALEYHLAGPAKQAVAEAEQVWASAQTVALEPTWLRPLGTFDQPIRFPARGFAAGLPADWHVLNPGDTAGQETFFIGRVTNYGSPIMPNVNVNANPSPAPPAPIQSEKYAKMLQEQAVAMMRRQRIVTDYQPIATRPASLGGRKAVELIAKATFGKIPSIQVQRQAYVNQRLYTVTVTYPFVARKRAELFMDTFAKSVRFTDIPEAKAE